MPEFPVANEAAVYPEEQRAAGMQPMPQGEMPPAEQPMSLEDIAAAEQEVIDAEEDARVQELDRLQMLTNIAEEIDDDTLQKIGQTVVEEYETDLNSRSESGWQESMDEAIDLARQVVQSKVDRSGEPRSNVKYPIISTAAIQFNARAYPSIVKGKRVVKEKVIGSDPDGMKAARASRVSQHMSFQILEQMDGWALGMDRLLMVLPIYGFMVRKIYYDPIMEVPKSDLLFPDECVFNYYAKDFNQLRRITHVLTLYENDIRERMNAGIFLEDEDVFVECSSDAEKDSTREDQPYTFLEQHRWWDLNDDGYKEPYIVTVEKETQKVVRIIARWRDDGVVVDEKGKVVKIFEDKYFVQYPFFPAFDGSCHCMGLGNLLEHNTRSINTVLNQLLDAGKAASRQGGFIGNGINLSKKTYSFGQGEWKTLNFKGDDIRKNLVPLPMREPSGTLFQLLGLLMESTKELASQSDLLAGQQPQGDVPATTTLALIEQGLKVYGGIYKRIHEALTREFARIQDLNRLFLNEEEYRAVLDDPQASLEDYANADYDILPVSDEADLTDTQRLTKAQALIEMTGRGLNDAQIFKNFLEALRIEDIEKYIPKEPPNPQDDPEFQLKMAEIQVKQAQIMVKAEEAKTKRMESFERMNKLRADAIKALAQAEAEEVGPQIEQYKAQLASIDKQIEMEAKLMEAQYAGRAANQGSPNAVAGAPGNAQGGGQVQKAQGRTG